VEDYAWKAYALLGPAHDLHLVTVPLLALNVASLRADSLQTHDHIHKFATCCSRQCAVQICHMLTTASDAVGLPHVPLAASAYGTWGALCSSTTRRVFMFALT
jgi:hypothetical protein